MKKVTFLEKWIAALRGEEFTQGRGQLVTASGSYCCLGVACRVRGLTIAEIRGQKCNGERGIRPSPSLRAQMGLTEKQEQGLIARNDSFRESFVDIALYIENTILPLHTKKHE